jgi:uncharacterized membrane protein YfcA
VRGVLGFDNARLLSTVPHLLALASLGVVAGALNAAAGGGSLLTFPALVALGLPALTANISNSVAQTPGYLAIAHGYRRELAGQRGRIRLLAPPAVLGGALGVALLELGSRSTFRALAPVLVLTACGLLVVQSHLRDFIRRSSTEHASRTGLRLCVMVAGAYTAYFGAAAGVLMLAVLGTFVHDELQRLNALSRLLILIVSALAAIVFIVLGPISWVAVLVLAPTTMIGGRLGVALVRRFSAGVLRACVLLIGIAASVYLIATSW